MDEEFSGIPEQAKLKVTSPTRPQADGDKESKPAGNFPSSALAGASRKGKETGTRQPTQSAPEAAGKQGRTILSEQEASDLLAEFEAGARKAEEVKDWLEGRGYAILREFKQGEVTFHVIPLDHFSHEAAGLLGEKIKPQITDSSEWGLAIEGSDRDTFEARAADQVSQDKGVAIFDPVLSHYHQEVLEAAIKSGRVSLPERVAAGALAISFRRQIKDLNPGSGLNLETMCKVFRLTEEEIREVIGTYNDYWLDEMLPARSKEERESIENRLNSEYRQLVDELVKVANILSSQHLDNWRKQHPDCRHLVLAIGAGHVSMLATDPENQPEELRLSGEVSARRFEEDATSIEKNRLVEQLIAVIEKKREARQESAEVEIKDSDIEQAIANSDLPEGLRVVIDDPTIIDLLFQQAGELSASEALDYASRPTLEAKLIGASALLLQEVKAARDEGSAIPEGAIVEIEDTFAGAALSQESELGELAEVLGGIGAESVVAFILASQENVEALAKLWGQVLDEAQKREENKDTTSGLKGGTREAVAELPQAVPEKGTGEPASLEGKEGFGNPTLVLTGQQIREIMDGPQEGANGRLQGLFQRLFPAEMLPVLGGKEAIAEVPENLVREPLADLIPPEGLQPLPAQFEEAASKEPIPAVLVAQPEIDKLNQQLERLTRDIDTLRRQIGERGLHLEFVNQRLGSPLLARLEVGVRGVADLREERRNLNEEIRGLESTVQAFTTVQETTEVRIRKETEAAQLTDELRKVEKEWRRLVADSRQMPDRLEQAVIRISQAGPEVFDKTIRQSWEESQSFYSHMKQTYRQLRELRERAVISQRSLVRPPRWLEEELNRLGKTLAHEEEAQLGLLGDSIERRWEEIGGQVLAYREQQVREWERQQEEERQQRVEKRKLMASKLPPQCRDNEGMPLPLNQLPADIQVRIGLSLGREWLSDQQTLNLDEVGAGGYEKVDPIRVDDQTVQALAEYYQPEVMREEVRRQEELELGALIEARERAREVWEQSAEGKRALGKIERSREREEFWQSVKEGARVIALSPFYAIAGAAELVLGDLDEPSQPKPKKETPSRVDLNKGTLVEAGSESGGVDVYRDTTGLGKLIEAVAAIGRRAGESSGPDQEPPASGFSRLRAAGHRYSREQRQAVMRGLRDFEGFEAQRQEQLQERGAGLQRRLVEAEARGQKQQQKLGERGERLARDLGAIGDRKAQTRETGAGRIEGLSRVGRQIAGGKEERREQGAKTLGGQKGSALPGKGRVSRKLEGTRREPPAVAKPVTAPPPSPAPSPGTVVGRPETGGKIGKKPATERPEIGRRERPVVSPVRLGKPVEETGGEKAGGKREKLPERKKELPTPQQPEIPTRVVETRLPADDWERLIRELPFTPAGQVPDQDTGQGPSLVSRIAGEEKTKERTRPLEPDRIQELRRDWEKRVEAGKIPHLQGEALTPEEATEEWKSRQEELARELLGKSINVYWGVHPDRVEQVRRLLKVAVEDRAKLAAVQSRSAVSSGEAPAETERVASGSEVAVPGKEAGGSIGPQTVNIYVGPWKEEPAAQSGVKPPQVEVPQSDTPANVEIKLVGSVPKEVDVNLTSPPPPTPPGLKSS